MEVENAFNQARKEIQQRYDFKGTSTDLKRTAEGGILLEAGSEGRAEAGLTVLMESMRIELARYGVAVTTIHPGFVDTPLTSQNQHPMPGLISADEAARRMIDGWRRGRFELHFPRRFTVWLKLLAMVGDGLYFRTVQRLTGL